MTIEHRTQGGFAIVKVKGRLDGETAPQFESACRDSTSGGATSLVVDLRELDYVSSAGLSSFLTVAKKLKANGGDMRICGIKGLVKEIFDMTRLAQLIPIFDSVDAATKSV